MGAYLDHGHWVKPYAIKAIAHVDKFLEEFLSNLLVPSKRMTKQFALTNVFILSDHGRVSRDVLESRWADHYAFEHRLPFFAARFSETTRGRELQRIMENGWGPGYRSKNAIGFDMDASLRKDEYASGFLTSHNIFHLLRALTEVHAPDDLFLKKTNVEMKIRTRFGIPVEWTIKGMTHHDWGPAVEKEVCESITRLIDESGHLLKPSICNRKVTEACVVERTSFVHQGSKTKLSSRYVMQVQVSFWNGEFRYGAVISYKSPPPKSTGIHVYPVFEISTYHPYKQCVPKEYGMVRDPANVLIENDILRQEIEKLMDDLDPQFCKCHL